MLYIEDNIVSITQNDDAVLEINLQTSAGEPYEMEAGDVLTLTVREYPRTGSPVLLAASSAPGSNRIVLSGADTQRICPGKYSYDVQIDMANGERYTVLPDLDQDQRGKTRNWKNFIIMPEVTVP